jgi:hypothetical protein
MAQQEVKEGTDDDEDLVGVSWFLVEIISYAQKEGRLKRAPTCICLLQITIESEKMGSASPHGVSQAFPIREELIELWAEEAFKGFH